MIQKKQIFWQGVVEDRKDPLKLGRCKVRIFGVHTENKQLLPTEGLPWANLSTSGQNITVPKEGEIVTGYFYQDDTDYPVIIGVIPGIKIVESNPQAGFSDPRSEAEKQAAPLWPEGTTSQKLDEPTTPRISRGDISDTPTKVANDNKEHVCDISQEIKLQIALTKLKTSSFIQTIRAEIEALIKSTSDSAFAQELQQAIRMITAKLKEVQKIAKFIDDVVVAIAQAVKEIREIITWILSLPARIIAFMQECLTKFLSSVQDALSDSFGSITGTGGETTLIADVKELVSTATTTVSTVASTVQATVRVYNDVTDLTKYAKV
jgi:hypothetical protein